MKKKRGNRRDVVPASLILSFLIVLTKIIIITYNNNKIKINK
jgi:hypothetical protein